jgi:hypothetical protein
VSRQHVAVYRFKAGYHLGAAQKHQQALACAEQARNDILVSHHRMLATDHAEQAAYYQRLLLGQHVYH